MATWLSSHIVHSHVATWLHSNAMFLFLVLKCEKKRKTVRTMHGHVSRFLCVTTSSGKVFCSYSNLVLPNFTHIFLLCSDKITCGFTFLLFIMWMALCVRGLSWKSCILTALQQTAKHQTNYSKFQQISKQFLALYIPHCNATN